MLPIFLPVAIIGIILSITSIQTSKHRAQSVGRGLLVSYFTILLLLGLGEGYFRYFHAESTAFYSLSQINWLKRYWHMNSGGFRDHDWRAEDFVNKTLVVVVGDSFTAGVGIKDPDDRYTDILAAALGDAYAVVNLGMPGSATPEQLELLKGFDVATPDIIIWQYFLNDIEYAALRVGLRAPVAVAPVFAQKSYLVNYIYNLLYSPEFDYWEWQYITYDNYVIWDRHRQEIAEMVSYIDGLGSDLIVVIFPNMVDPVGSIAYVDRVEQALAATGHNQIVKLFDAVAAWPTGTPLVVSNKDAHPSVEFNRFVADELLRRFFN